MMMKRQYMAQDKGSGNSPMIWCFISSLLFDCYDALAHQASYCNPDRTNMMQINMIGFVDDSNGQVNSFLSNESKEELQQLVKKAEYNATTWSQLLHATGGALELSKCSYHILYWQFASHGAPVLGNIISNAQPITVPDPLSGEKYTMEYLPPSVAHKTLGHYKEPMGIQKVQFQRLKEKSDQATEFLWTTHLTRQEAWTFYHSCYLPSVMYPLTSSFLSEKQLDKIQQKAMTIIYAKCGFNRHTKREVLFGPRELGGAEFSRLFIKQGIAQAQYLLRHWRIHSTIGKLMKCALAWIQLSLGVSFPLLERVHVSLPHLESKWFASLRRFLATIDAAIQLDNPEVPPTQREHDEYIMDLIMNARRFSNAEIRKLNYCRLYLQVVTLADVTKPNGVELDPNLLRGYPSLMSSKSTLLSVNQDRPSEKEWMLWRKANLIWSSPDGTLLRPLGNWTRRVQDQRQSHFAYVHRSVLYVREVDTTYRKYRTHGESHYRQSSWRQYTIHQIAPQACPVEVSLLENGRWKLEGVAHKVVLPQERLPSIINTFSQYVQTLTSWEIELLNHVRMELDPCALCVALESGFRAVSDGSVRRVTHGAFGWALSSGSGTRLAYGMGPASGHKPTSYRAEAYGLLSLLRFLIRLREFSHMHEEWSGEIATDSKSVRRHVE
jgi:hypothetical protein